MSLSNHQITIVIADKYPYTCRGIKDLIRSKNYKEFSFAHSLDNAVECLTEAKHGYVIITDETLYEYGKEGLKMLKEKFPDTGIVLLTGADNSSGLRFLFSLKFAAIIHKINTANEIEKAIDHAVNNKEGCHTCSYLLNLLKNESNNPENSRGKKGTIILSEQEAEVLKHKFQGKPNKIIGLDIDLTTATVNTYYKQAKSKMRRWGKGGFLDYAIEFGIISFDELLKKRT
ncbi:MAG: LuxR C-terminal-related transcriptional regulator [Bacteroidia bacterium]